MILKLQTAVNTYSHSVSCNTNHNISVEFSALCVSC